jgi:formylglycine-generating enzyme required for sulfatase activity
LLVSLLAAGCSGNEAREKQRQSQEETRKQHAQKETGKKQQPTQKEIRVIQRLAATSLGVQTHDTLDLGKGVTLKLVLIPAGKFLMGSPATEKGRYFNDEGPQHRVMISSPFYMGVTEVTQEQYEIVMGKNPSSVKGKMLPVEMVSWNDAVAFCRTLSKKTGKAARLPTEAEWEYACRAGTTTRFSFGDDDAELHKYGNYCDRSCTEDMSWNDKKYSDGYDRTAPVGSFKPNAFGLYDMHGNVWEWCADWWKTNYHGALGTDPQGPVSGIYRVFRSGSWLHAPRSCRSARRSNRSPGGRSGSMGFRIVVNLE